MVSLTFNNQIIFMRYIKFYFSFLVLIGFFISSCSKLQDNINPPETVSIHGSGVLQKGSTDFHGLNVKQNGLASCQVCHGVNFNGGTSQISCSTSNCHPGITVHKTGITDTTSANFHGIYISASNWNLTQCSQCHGDSFSGGIASPSCNTCHNNPGGPEACNNCHGNLSNTAQINPPRDTKGNTDTKFAGVGAHTKHLTGITIGQNVPCTECHVIPKNFSDAGHINQSGNASITFGTFTNSGVSSASYDFSTNKCTNTYCHGNFAFNKSNSKYKVGYADGFTQITGNNFQPIWNKVDGTQAACGTCHGLPPTGHVYADLTGCWDCHPGVVDGYGKIIDKTKHMNGKVDVFGIEY
jgi:hypothetical protein